MFEPRVPLNDARGLNDLLDCFVPFMYGLQSL